MTQKNEENHTLSILFGGAAGVLSGGAIGSAVAIIDRAGSHVTDGALAIGMGVAGGVMLSASAVFASGVFGVLMWGVDKATDDTASPTSFIGSAAFGFLAAFVIADEMIVPAEKSEAHMYKNEKIIKQDNASTVAMAPKGYKLVFK